MSYNNLINDRLGTYTIDNDASAIADANGVDGILADGVMDIIEKCRQFKPQLLPLFAYESSTGSTNNRELKNIDLLRVAAQFSSVQYPARYVTPDEFLKAGISGSIYEATTSDPIYTIRKKTVFVLPSGGEDYLFDIILPDTSVNADAAPGNTNPSNFPEDMHHLLVMYATMRVIDYIIGTKGHDAGSSIVAARTKIDELFVETSDQPDLIDIQDALDKAQNLVDGASMGGDSATAESAQYWLLDEDPEMVSSTVSVASQEISRASTIMATMDKKIASLSKYTELVPVYLQEIQGLATIKAEILRSYNEFFQGSQEEQKNEA
jgi:hypothetical protein